MFKKLKNQSPGKIFIMLWNVFRMAFLKVTHMKNTNISLIQNINPTTEIAVRGGTLTLEHSIFTRRYVSFRVESGVLKIGTSFFNQGCSVTALQKIQIGDNCLFGPNVIIIDHDHDYTCPNEQRGSQYICRDVVIGDNVVVGANSVILKGSHIGNNCMIGAGTIVSGEIPEGTLYINEHRGIEKIIKFQ